MKLFKYVSVMLLMPMFAMAGIQFDPLDLTNYGYISKTAEEMNVSTQDDCSDKECRLHHSHTCTDLNCQDRSHKKGGDFCCNMMYISDFTKVLGHDMSKALFGLLEDRNFTEEEMKPFAVNSVIALVNQLEGVRDGQVGLNNHRTLERAVPLAAFVSLLQYDSIKNGDFEIKFLPALHEFGSFIKKHFSEGKNFILAEDVSKELQESLTLEGYKLNNECYVGKNKYFLKDSQQAKDILPSLNTMIDLLNGYFKDSLGQKTTVVELGATGIADSDTIVPPKLNLQMAEKKVFEVKKKKILDAADDFEKLYKIVISSLTEKKGNPKQEIEDVKKFLNEETLIDLVKELKGVSNLREAVSNKCTDLIDRMESLKASKAQLINLGEILKSWMGTVLNYTSDFGVVKEKRPEDKPVEIKSSNGSGTIIKATGLDKFNEIFTDLDDKKLTAWLNSPEVEKSVNEEGYSNSTILKELRNWARNPKVDDTWSPKKRGKFTNFVAIVKKWIEGADEAQKKLKLEENKLSKELKTKKVEIKV